MVFRRSFDSSLVIESPLLERKRLKSKMVDDQIKMECDKNHFIEEEIKVISKEEDQENKAKIQEYEKMIIGLEREIERYSETVICLQKTIEENKGKIEKITQKNENLISENELLVNEKNILTEEKKEINTELDTLKKKLAFYEKKVTLTFTLANFIFFKKE